MKLVNGNIKCYLHSGLKIEGKKIKNKQNSICIEETLIVNRSIKTEDHENSLEKIIKKQKTSETTVKLSSNNKILSIIDKGKDKMYRFNNDIMSIIKIKKKGTKIELSHLLENF